MKGFLATLGFLGLLALGSITINVGISFYYSILAGLSLAGAAVIYGWYLILRSTKLGNSLLALSIIFIIIGSIGNLYLADWIGASIYLFSMVLAGALLVSWIANLGLSATAYEGLKEKSKGRLNIKGISKGIGVGIGIIVSLFAVAYLASYMLANNNQTPVLAGKEIILPNTLKPAPAEQAVSKILINPQTKGALIDFTTTDNKLIGLYRGDPENPIGSIIKTNYGNLVITSELSSKVETTTQPIKPSKISGTRNFLVTLIASLVDAFSFLSDPKNFYIVAGFTLYFIGYSISK